jgi:dTDP-4-amino-4,6-dideoxygalactose transaminase
MSWVTHKKTDFDNVKEILEESYRTNHFTNYGPVAKRIEKFFFEKLELSEEKAVIVTNNGAHALHALTEGIKLFLNKELTFTTQDFTFPSALQGPLNKSHVVDVDSTFQFDLNQLRKDSDGIIVTNLFGTCCDIKKFVDYSKNNNKILIFDNATCPYTYYESININNYGNGTIISLHHTKPIGFGEGGLIVVDKQFEESIRSILNFGYKNTGVRVWNPKGNNYKISDIGAAFILDYQSHVPSIREHSNLLFNYVRVKLEGCDKIKFFPNYSSSSLLSCIPLVYNGNAYLKIRLLNDKGYEARQYYPPLVGLVNSTYLFSKIICLPCNLSISIEIMNDMLNLILND